MSGKIDGCEEMKRKSGLRKEALEAFDLHQCPIEEKVV